MARMTKTSKENLLVADAIRIESNKTYPDWIVSMSRNGNIAYLSDSQGPIRYKSISEARRTVKRIRPDFEPTTI